MAAGKTDTPLGCFYRRKAAQFGGPKAITATARKLACLVRRRAHELGYELVEIPKAA
jgi:hypothetical protein